MKLPFLSLLLGCACGIATSAVADPTGPYHAIAHYPIAGDGGYDYLRIDPIDRRLYVAHEKKVDVLDVDSGKPIGTISGLVRAHGIALANEAGHGFATSGIDNQVTMFDLKNLQVLRVIKSTGSNPDAIEFDPGTKRIYAANHGSGEITVIDPTSGDVLGTVHFGEGKLEGIAFDGRGRGYVNAEDKSSVFVFDLKTLQPLAKWSLAPGEGGTGLAVDAKHHRVFSSCSNNHLVVLDSDSGKVIATPAIGADPDGLAYDEKTKRIFSTNSDETLSIVQQNSADDYTTLQTVTTQAGCRTITLDTKTGNIATCAPKFGPRPVAVAGGPRPRPPILPGTFEAFLIGTN